MEIRPDILLFAMVVGIAFAILALVSVIRRAMEKPTAYHHWMRANYLCLYEEEYGEAITQYQLAEKLVDSGNPCASTHRLAIGYGQAAAYFMMDEFESSSQLYEIAVPQLAEYQIADFIAGEPFSMLEFELTPEQMWWSPQDFVETLVSSLARLAMARTELGRVDDAKSARDELRHLASNCDNALRIDFAAVLHHEAVQLPLQRGHVAMADEFKDVVIALVRDSEHWATGQLGELQGALAESCTNCGALEQAHELVSLLLQLNVEPRVADLATVLAANLSCQAGELHAAINLYEQSIAGRTALFGRESVAVAMVRLVLGDVLRIRGDYEAARSVLLSTGGQRFDTDEVFVTTARRAAAMMAAHDGDADRVEELFGFLMQSASLAPSPVTLAETHLLEAYCWMAQDNARFALQSARAAADLAATVYPPDHPLLCPYWAMYAWLLVSSEPDEADLWLQRAATAHAGDAKNFKLLDLQLKQTEAELNLARGDYDKAEAGFLQLLSAADQIFLSSSLTHAEGQCLMGEVCLATGRVSDSIRWLQKSLSTRNAAGQPATHPSLRHPVTVLAEAMRKSGDHAGAQECEAVLVEIEAARQRPEFVVTENPYQP